MAEVYDFNYALYREDLKFCNEKLGEILIELNEKMDMINEVAPILNKSQRLFCIMQEKDKTGALCRKFWSLGELIENTQLGFDRFCKDFKNFYDLVAEEKTDIERQISSKSMTEDDVANLVKLYNFRLDELELESEGCCNDVKNHYNSIKGIGEDIHKLHMEYKRGGDFSKVENRYQRGELRIVK